MEKSIYKEDSALVYTDRTLVNKTHTQKNKNVERETSVKDLKHFLP